VISQRKQLSRQSAQITGLRSKLALLEKDVSTQLSVSNNKIISDICTAEEKMKTEGFNHQIFGALAQVIASGQLAPGSIEAHHLANLAYNLRRNHGGWRWSDKEKLFCAALKQSSPSTYDKARGGEFGNGTGAGTSVLLSSFNLLWPGRSTLDECMRHFEADPGSSSGKRKSVEPAKPAGEAAVSEKKKKKKVPTFLRTPVFHVAVLCSSAPFSGLII
jgi:hypothetical protein